MTVNELILEAVPRAERHDPHFGIPGDRGYVSFPDGTQRSLRWVYEGRPGVCGHSLPVFALEMDQGRAFPPLVTEAAALVARLEAAGSSSGRAETFAQMDQRAKARAAADRAMRRLRRRLGF